MGLTLSLAIRRTTSSVKAFWYPKLVIIRHGCRVGWTYADGAETEESGGLDVVDDIDQVGQRRTIVICPGEVYSIR